MKFDEKKRLFRKIKLDILIGICLGILGNALYVWLTDDLKLNRLIVIGIFTLILLWMMFRKEEESSTHSRIEIGTEYKIENADIMHIKDKFFDAVKNNWKKEDIGVPQNNIFQFILDNIAIFKVTLDERCILIEYYEQSSEAEDYLLPKFIEIIGDYKRNKSKLVSKNKLHEAVSTPRIVYGRVLYKEE